MFDDTYARTPTQGWMFVPLNAYHGGGAAAAALRGGEGTYMYSSPAAGMRNGRGVKVYRGVEYRNGPGRSASRGRGRGRGDCD